MTTLLFYNSSHFNLLEELFKEYSDLVIFSTNNKSANELEMLGIEYLSTKDLFTESDFQAIDFKVQQMVPEILENTIFDSLSYDKISLSSLLHWEVHHTFSKLYSKLFIYDRIIKESKPSLVLGNCGETMFSNIEKFMSEKNSIQFKTIGIDDTKSAFHLDTLPIQFKIGQNLINITPQQYIQFKKIAEKFLKFFTGKKMKHPLVLLDFNISIWASLLKDFVENNVNHLLLNKRKPIFWNKSTFKEQLFGRYPFTTLDEYKTKDSMDKIKQDELELFNKIDEIWNSLKIPSLFVFEGFSIWELIQNDLKSFFQNRMSSYLQDIIFAKNFFEIEKPSGILMWGWVLPFEKIITSLAHRNNIPTFNIQDGVKSIGSSHKFGKLFKPDEIVIDTDYVLAWGNYSKKYFEDFKTPPKTIIPLGSPKYDELFKHASKILKPKKNNVLLITTGFGPSSLTHGVNFLKKYEDYIRNVSYCIQNMPHLNLIIKLHPYPDERIDIPSIVKEIDPKIKILKHENIYDLISNSDLVISSSSSTVILESMILKIPTMIVNLTNDDESIHLPYIKSGASIEIKSLEDIDYKINEFFSNPEIAKSTIINSQQFLDDYLFNQGYAGKEISKFIKTKLATY